MKLENQNNLVKAEITKLYEMLTTKIEEMEKLNAPRPDVRRLAKQQFAVKTILENYFDFHNCNQNKEIEVLLYRFGTQPHFCMAYVIG
jgi:hypothetical protein